MRTDKEFWSPIKGYEQYYEVSTFGRVRNRKTKNVLINDHNSAGRHRLFLYKPLQRQWFVDELVARTFCIGYKESYMPIHKDGDITNDMAANLEWGPNPKAQRLSKKKRNLIEQGLF